MPRDPGRPIRSRFATFNIVGLLGVLVQLGCLWALRSLLHVHYILATALAVELAILHNFCWHVRWTWSDRPSDAAVVRRLVRFNATNGAVSIAGNVVLMAVLVEQAHLPVLLANIISITVCASLNFVLSDRIVFAPLGCVFVAWTLFWGAQAVSAAELRQEAGHAFERYAQLTEARLDQEGRGELPFLWLNRLVGAERRDAGTRLGVGEVIVSRLDTLDRGQEIRFPGSMCHHWVGTVFVPRVRLIQVVATMQAYDDYETLYRPAVRRSTTLSRRDDRFSVYLQLFQKRIVSVVLNTESDVTYLQVSSRRMQVRSRSMRIAEVDRPGTSDEREKPVGRDNGFLWRFNNYCSLDESDAGVYVQCESLSLSRDIPAGLGWLIDPFVSAVPRDSLEFTLRALRAALAKALP